MSRGRNLKRAAVPLVVCGFCALGAADTALAGADVIVSAINGHTSYGTVMTCTSYRKECYTDANCNACSGSGGSCMVDGDCPEGETCIITGDACDTPIASFSVGTTACNVGDVPLNWCNLNTAYCDADEHPAIAQNMYRLRNGRFEQIGMSWVKHGFAAVDSPGCGLTCTNAGTNYLLGVGCSDVYTPTLNGTQQYLGPRSEVNPDTGVFPYPYNLHAYEVGDTVFKRLQVHVEDLWPAYNTGARYFSEAQYIMSDDAADRNGNNNVSHHEITIEGPDAQGRFLPYLAGGTIRELPAIRSWAANEPDVVESDVQVPGEGLFILASKATLLVTGYWQYEYALYNMNSDRAAGSLFVPLPLGAIVRNVGFHDVEYHSDEPYDGTDWNHSIAGPGITWSTETYATDPNANALRWGTLYNFRFESNMEPDPTPGTAVVGLFKPGTPESMEAPAVVPLLAVVDCNDNGIADDVDIAQGTSVDCDENAIPDECQADCNNNQVADTCDLTDGTSLDCNVNDVPDECEADCDGNGRPDACDIDVNSTAPGGPFYCVTDCDPDCNTNGVPDACDPDCNGNGVPDGCYGDPVDPDTDGDGVSDCVDECPLTSPPAACDCPLPVCCDLPPFGECALVILWDECEAIGGTPACTPSDLCRNGCLIGDANDNGALDLYDWGPLQNCFSGPIEGPGFIAPSADCLRWFDFDGDGDVDLADSAAWYGAAYPGG